MPVYNYAFAGGQNATTGFGDQWKIGFAGAWVYGDTWKITFATTQGDFVVGRGRLSAGPPTFCFTYRKRVYLANLTQWNFSDNDDPTEWEVQGPGADFVEFESQLGGSDQVQAFGQLQGRLAVFAKKTVQIWTVDADPNNFNLVQSIDNVGTRAPGSIASIGDLDLLFLDDTGIRSLRTMEVTLNSVLDDVGSPVDDFVQDRMDSAETAVAIVDPATKNYWLFLKDTIFVLAKFPSSKVIAWSTYEPKDTAGNIFNPERFIVFQSKVYCRTRENTLITYGGATGNQYDGSVVTVETPWMDDKTPGMFKMSMGIDFVISGGWNIYCGMNPKSKPAPPHPEALQKVISYGDGSNPNEALDSSSDIGTVAFPCNGTHFKMKAVSSDQFQKVAILSSLTFHYNKGASK